jgi:hypothetical protein
MRLMGWSAMRVSTSRRYASGSRPFSFATEYHVDMSRIFPQCLDASLSDRSAKSDVLLRQEPEEEEDEEDEGDHREDDEDEDRDDGYSE